MKLIFLDVDGVLNSSEYMEKEHSRLGHEKYVKKYLKNGGIPFTPDSIKYFTALVKTTQALICVSSTWRLCKDQKERLNNALGETSNYIIGYTKNLQTIREIEIKEFLDNLKILKCPLESYVIIDDDNDMLPEQQDNFVKIDMEKGFTMADGFKCLNILNERRINMEEEKFQVIKNAGKSVEERNKEDKENKEEKED